MLPHTHFLFALFLSSIFLRFSYFTLLDFIFVALIAMFIDIDHLIACYYKYHTLNVRMCWHKALTGKENLRTAVHHKNGFIIILSSIILLSMWKLKWAIIISIAYFSHVFLDSIISAKKMRDTYITPSISYENGLNIALIILIGLSLTL